MSDYPLYPIVIQMEPFNQVVIQYKDASIMYMDKDSVSLNLVLEFIKHVDKVKEDK